MPKVNVYLPDELAAAVREARLPVSTICQDALERAVRAVDAVQQVAESLPDVDVQQTVDWSRRDAEATRPFSRFSPRARHAIAAGREAARDAGHPHVGTEHLLLGILDEGDNLGLRVLESLGVEADDVRAELDASMPPRSPHTTRHPRMTDTAKRSLKAALGEAIRRGHNYIGCEHLLLGLLDTDGGTASEVLRRMGVEPRAARRAVDGVLAGFVHARRELESQATPSEPTRPPTDQPASTTLDEIVRRLDAIERRLDG